MRPFVDDGWAGKGLLVDATWTVEPEDKGAATREDRAGHNRLEPVTRKVSRMAHKKGQGTYGCDPAAHMLNMFAFLEL